MIFQFLVVCTAFTIGIVVGTYIKPITFYLKIKRGLIHESETTSFKEWLAYKLAEVTQEYTSFSARNGRPPAKGSPLDTSLKIYQRVSTQYSIWE